MADSIFFIGHVSIDEVENVNGVRVQPGGAALYAAMAAKTLLDDVRLVSMIGRDYRFMDALKPFPSRYIGILNIPSTKFGIHYNEMWEASYPKAEYGVGSRISASTVPFRVIGPNSIIHISPLHPQKVKGIVGKIREFSSETIISINTWMGYIKGRKTRDILREMALKADIFILNDGEAKALTRAGSLSTALRLLKAKMLVVTLGELGAIISRENGEIQMVPALNFPVGKIIDTTGAGDVWCGAFLAAYKLVGNLMKSVTAASIISSIKCSGWGFSRLQSLRFREVDDIIEYVIGLREGSLQKRISDYFLR